MLGLLVSKKPKLGYKLVKSLFGKYEEIPEDWEIKKLFELSEKVKDIVAGPFGSNLVVSDYETEGVPIIRLQNIGRNRFINKNIKFISREKANELNYHSYRPGDLVLAKLGIPIGKTCKIPEEFPAGIVVADVVRIRTSSKKSNQVYVEYVLNSNICEKQLNKERIGTTRPRVNLNQIRNLIFPCPPVHEQKKIASILSSVDSLVSSYDDIIQKSKILKKGLMQQLLTKGISHKKFKKVKWFFGKEIEIPNNWISKKVEDVFKLKSGSTPSRTKPEFFEGDISWVTSTDLNRSKITSTLEKITKYAVKDANLTILPKGTFVIATYGLEAAGTRGKCGILEMDATCNQACMAFLPSSEMSSMFLFYFYLYFGEKIIFSIAQGTKQQNLYSDTVKKVTLIIPPLKEQEKITSILSEIDSNISNLESNQHNLKSLKKGLMQKLLTGQIRVKV